VRDTKLFIILIYAQISLLILIANCNVLLGFAYINMLKTILLLEMNGENARGGGRERARG
jgi:hypothetical protein